MGLVRKNVLNITAYSGGKPIEETKREFGLKRVVKLASNENPLGASPRALTAIKNSVASINRYPDGQSFYLKERLSRKLKVSAENIVLGNGSDELIDIIIKTFVEENENIISADNTFLEYKIISQVNNRRFITVALKDFRYDLEAIRARMDKKTKLVFIANPNNPTGTYVAKKELETFISNIPKNIILVLDEAYDTFIDVSDYSSGFNYFKKNNVIVLRTFSKAYGLAGLRIGYALTSSYFAAYMERVRQPFNVNLLAQAGALAALDDDRFLKKVKQINAAGKAYLYRELDKLGLKYIPSVTNFILVNAGYDGVLLFKAMLKKGVIIRDMRQYGLNRFFRVTIGTEKENKLFIRSLKDCLVNGG